MTMRGDAAGAGAGMQEILAGRMNAAQAAVLLDLWQAGVTVELGETAFDWWAMTQTGAKTIMQADTPAVVMDRAAPVVQERAQPAAMPVKTESADAFAAALKALESSKSRPKAKAAAVDEAVASVTEAKPVVWHLGDPGGVVLVVRGTPGQAGSVPLQGKMQELVRAMLQAVGLQDLPVGWAVLGCEQETVQPALQDELRKAVLTLAPQHVLVMGQVVVGTLAGQALGVEGWQAAAKPLLPDAGEVRVGVTYPPELLLARPLFKRLAWQHLQKWRFG